VFNADRISRPAIASVLTGALIVFAFGGVAAAAPTDEKRALAQEAYYSQTPQTIDRATAAAKAQERYYSSFAAPQAIDRGTAAAQAQERYYASYGAPEPQQVPSDDTPWEPIAAFVALSLAAIAAGTTRHRWPRVRRRAPRFAA
jgi:uncharacterized protein YfaQ (DUF2300 family)